MPWFKADDSLHSHLKTIRASDTAAGREAMGLWIVAGTWAAANLTDGRVPLAVVKRLGWAKRHAEKLVEVGMWERADDGTYEFHDWSDYQPMASEVLDKREAKAAAGRKGGFASGRSRREADASSKPEAPASSSVEPPSRPVPTRTRPVPSKDSAQVSDKGALAKSEPKPTHMVWDAYSAAYVARYGVEPTRNARLNGQLAHFVKRVPAEDAPGIASTYVRSNNRRYVASGHSIGCLLQDAEKLHMELRTGRQGTARAAHEADKRAGRLSEYEEMFARLREKDESEGALTS